MSFIVYFFFLTYSAIHYYFFYKLKAAFQPSLLLASLIAVFFVIMVTSPLTVYFIERWGGPVLARTLAYICYSWMGFLFFVFCLSLIFDLYRLFLFLLGHLLRHDFNYLILSPKSSLFCMIVLSLGFFSYGFFEARDLRVERLVVKTTKMPPSAKLIRIVQVSDLHIGFTMRGERLRKVIEKIKETNPDILVSTGDLVDGGSHGLLTEHTSFHDITPPLGKFAITGNHEFYAGLDRALEFTQRAGFTVLRGEAVNPGGMINVVGFDDLLVRGDRSVRQRSFREVLSNLSPDKFTLLLYHRPLIDKDSLGTFDLQLSGHTHKGQIFPFCLLTRLFFPMHSGYYSLPKGSFLYVSPGAGTWGPPIRFLSPPAITVIDLVPGS